MQSMAVTSADLRIWFLSQVLGWPGRRVATEVGVSQSTVVRTVERLRDDPPTEQEMQDFMSGTTTTSSTPPNGMRVLKTDNLRPEYSSRSPLILALTGAVILITLSVTVVLIALAIAILQH